MLRKLSLSQKNGFLIKKHVLHHISRIKLARSLNNKKLRKRMTDCFYSDKFFFDFYFFLNSKPANDFNLFF